MSMPFYVSPEQVMKDKADYARKGIARGRSVVVIAYADGLLFVAENASRALHKISEIYDRIAFAAVGKYNEFENLRVAGVRVADLRGFSYDRRDVAAVVGVAPHVGVADAALAQVLELVVLADGGEADPVVDLADLAQGAGRVLGDEGDPAVVAQDDRRSAARDVAARVVGVLLVALLGGNVEGHRHDWLPSWAWSDATMGAISSSGTRR